MSLLKSTLNLLSDGKFHSEKEISHFLGLPRCIIPDTLQQLLEPSIHFEKIEDKGYRIPGGLELLNEKLICNELGHTNSLLKHLEILNEINSTNTYLLEKKATSKTMAVFAEQQTAGRGQFNRPWLSPGFGKNIALSILYQLPNKPDQLKGLSLVMGIAIVHALQEYGLKEIKLKWPNDVVHHAKKLAGILIEIKNSSKAGFSSIVIGIGLNLYNPTTSPEAIKQTITDIYSIQKLAPQRNRLAGLLLKNCLLTLSEFQTKGFSAFIESWHQLDSLKDKPIRIETAKELQEGIARGINSQGQLCIDIDGEPHCFSSGEVRILHNYCPENC